MSKILQAGRFHWSCWGPAGWWQSCFEACAAPSADYGGQGRKWHLGLYLEQLAYFGGPRDTSADNQESDLCKSFLMLSCQEYPIIKVLGWLFSHKRILTCVVWCIG